MKKKVDKTHVEQCNKFNRIIEEAIVAFKIPIDAQITIFMAHLASIIAGHDKDTNTVTDEFITSMKEIIQMMKVRKDVK